MKSKLVKSINWQLIPAAGVIILALLGWGQATSPFIWTARIFSYLRHLMQHLDRLAFIFVGTHTLEALNPSYWSAFFNVVLHRRVSYLEEKAARALITAPVAPQLIYDDLAIDKMLRVTGGLPISCSCCATPWSARPIGPNATTWS